MSKKKPWFEMVVKRLNICALFQVIFKADNICNRDEPKTIGSYYIFSSLHKRRIPMSLQAKIKAYKQGMMKKVPQDTLDIMHRATEDLKNSGIMNHTIKIGDRAHDFALEDTRGDRGTLQDFLQNGPLVVTLYRGKW
jgi:hypothetical protein